MPEVEKQPDLVFKDDLEGIRRLNSKQILFIGFYLECGNVKEASLKAGYSSPQYGLMKVPEVVEAIATARKEQLQRIAMSADEVIARLSAMARADARRLFRDDGSPRAIQDLDDDVALLITGLEVREEFGGRGEGRELVGQVKKYKLVDPMRALEILGKFHKLWADRVEVEGIDSLAERLQKARQNANKEEK